MRCANKTNQMLPFLCCWASLNYLTRKTFFSSANLFNDGRNFSVNELWVERMEKGFFFLPLRMARRLKAIGRGLDFNKFFKSDSPRRSFFYLSDEFYVTMFCKVIIFLRDNKGLVSRVETIMPLKPLTDLVTEPPVNFPTFRIHFKKRAFFHRLSNFPQIPSKLLRKKLDASGKIAFSTSWIFYACFASIRRPLELPPLLMYANKKISIISFHPFQLPKIPAPLRSFIFRIL